MGFPRQEYWNGVPCPSPGDLPDPGIKPVSPALLADSLPSEPQGKPYKGIYTCKNPVSSTPDICTHHRMHVILQKSNLWTSWWSSGYDSTLPTQGVWVQSLVRKLRFHMPHSVAKKSLSLELGYKEYPISSHKQDTARVAVCLWVLRG